MSGIKLITLPNQQHRLNKLLKEKRKLIKRQQTYSNLDFNIEYEFNDFNCPTENIEAIKISNEIDFCQKSTKNLRYYHDDLMEIEVKKQMINLYHNYYNKNKGITSVKTKPIHKTNHALSTIKKYALNQIFSFLNQNDLTKLYNTKNSKLVEYLKSFIRSSNIKKEVVIEKVFTYVKNTKGKFNKIKLNLKKTHMKIFPKTYSIKLSVRSFEDLENFIETLLLNKNTVISKIIVVIDCKIKEKYLNTLEFMKNIVSLNERIKSKNLHVAINCSNVDFMKEDNLQIKKTNLNQFNTFSFDEETKDLILDYYYGDYISIKNIKFNFFEFIDCFHTLYVDNCNLPVLAQEIINCSSIKKIIVNLFLYDRFIFKPPYQMQIDILSNIIIQNTSIKDLILIISGENEKIDFSNLTNALCLTKTLKNVYVSISINHLFSVVVMMRNVQNNNKAISFHFKYELGLFAKRKYFKIMT